MLHVVFRLENVIKILPSPYHTDSYSSFFSTHWQLFILLFTTLTIIHPSAYHTEKYSSFSLSHWQFFILLLITLTIFHPSPYHTKNNSSFSLSHWQLSILSFGYNNKSWSALIAHTMLHVFLSSPGSLNFATHYFVNFSTIHSGTANELSGE